MNSATLLEAIITQRRKELLSYVQSPNAKGFYIQKENSLLQSLIEIFNGIKPLKYQGLWQCCEEIMLNCTAKDANFSGMLLEIRLKSKGELCFQNFNLHDDEI